MTPLPRWVFLASLLGSAVAVEAHPSHDACGYVSLAEMRSTETNGACDERRLSHQFLEERQGWFEYLFQLCLVPCRIPCSEPCSNDRSPVYVGTEDCRSFRKALIGLGRCSVDPAADSSRWDAVTSLRWLVRNVYRKDEDSYDYGKPVEEILKSLHQEGTVDPFYNINHFFDERNFFDIIGRVYELHSRQTMVTEAAGKEIENADGQTDTTVEPDASAEKPIDWEMWCMAQCDHGQGGAACNCDLIP